MRISLKEMKHGYLSQGLPVLSSEVKIKRFFVLGLASKLLCNYTAQFKLQN